MGGRTWAPWMSQLRRQEGFEKGIAEPASGMTINSSAFDAV